MDEHNPNPQEHWERGVLERLLNESLREQRRSRRWGIFFKLLGFGYLFILILIAMRSPGLGDEVSGANSDHTAMVEINGLISDGSEANADTIIKGLRKAFASDYTKGVVLRINSPGGSPVQSAYVYGEIRRLRKLHPKIPLYAVIVDVGASGAYYIASAADKIFANPASVVGSIGVRMDGFGFTGAMHKLGIERRLLTAGKHKGMLDPFSPQNPQDVAHAKQVLKDIHQQFIQAVKDGRGKRLADNPELFSGMFWDGKRGLELGLIDGYGDVDYVARDVIGQKEVVDYTPKQDIWKRMADRLGASVGHVIANELGVSGPTLR